MATIPAHHSKKNLPVESVAEWREVAARVSAETDPNKVLDLAQELIRALDENSREGLDHVTIESRMRDKGAA